jgi:hypothetical protein
MRTNLPVSALLTPATERLTPATDVLTQLKNGCTKRDIFKSYGQEYVCRQDPWRNVLTPWCNVLTPWCNVLTQLKKPCKEINEINSESVSLATQTRLA